MHHNNRMDVARSCEAALFARPGVLRLFCICPRCRFPFPRLKFNNPLHNEQFSLGASYKEGMDIGKANQDGFNRLVAATSKVLREGRICLGTNESILKCKSVPAG